MRALYLFPLSALLLVSTVALADDGHAHDDIVIGRNAAGDALTVGGRIANPERAYLPFVDGLLHGHAGSDPGFDRVVTPHPAHDLYPLESGAEIWIEIVSLPPDFHVFTPTFVELKAGDEALLGDSALHVHFTWWIEIEHAAHDPNDWSWPLVFRLHDRGTTGYASTGLLRLEFTSVEACRPGDVDGNGSVDFFDIDPFLDALTGSGDRCTLCAADTDGDNDVDFFDIDGFLKLLGTVYE